MKHGFLLTTVSPLHMTGGGGFGAGYGEGWLCLYRQNLSWSMLV